MFPGLYHTGGSVTNSHVQEYRRGIEDLRRLLKAELALDTLRFCGVLHPEAAEKIGCTVITDLVRVQTRIEESIIRVRKETKHSD